MAQFFPKRWNLKFKAGSVELTAEDKGQLKPLGEALQNKQLRSRYFVVAGHTDKRGNPSRNLELSKKRAENVRWHLVRNFGIDLFLLTAVGLGSERPLDATDPYSPINRRVTIS